MFRFHHRLGRPALKRICSEKIGSTQYTTVFCEKKAWFNCAAESEAKLTVNLIHFSPKIGSLSNIRLLLFPTQQVFCIEKYLRLMISLVWVNVSSEQVILNYPRYHRQGCFILRMISDVVRYKMCDNKSCWETRRYRQCFLFEQGFFKWLTLLKWAWSLVHLKFFSSPACSWSSTLILKSELCSSVGIAPFFMIFRCSVNSEPIVL